MKFSTKILILFVALSAAQLVHCQVGDPFEWQAAMKSGKIEISVKIPEGHYLYKDQTSISVKDAGKKSQTLAQAPKTTLHKDQLLGEVPVYAGGKTYRWSYDTDGHPPYNVTVDYQGCKDQTMESAPVCFLPQSLKLSIANAKAEPGQQPVVVNRKGVNSTERSRLPAPLQQDLPKFKIRSVASGEMNAAEFIKFLKGRSASSEKGLNTESILLLVLTVVLGGLLLNLTPCVLPMIPINLAIIGAGMNADSKYSGFVRGALYGLGMALSYGVLGIVVILTGARFGTLNSHAWFNFIIALVFTVLSLAMFGVINIDFAKYGNKLGPSGENKGNLLVVFSMGAVAALLAGACVAPVVIAVLLHSAALYASHNPFGLFLPVLLGAGMALPWPFAGAGLSFLPKPGKWMKKVKALFGIVILVFALNYAYKGYLLLPANTPETEGTKELARALQESIKNRKPVVIDFWATWCSTCRKMETSTFRDKQVKALLANEFIFVKFQAEKIDDPLTAEVLDYFNVSGLPTYVILAPESRTE